MNSVTTKKPYIASDDLYYVAVKETYRCRGCAFEYNADDCQTVANTHGGCIGIIWIKQPTQQKKAEVQPTKQADQPKYTLTEFLEAYNVWGKMTDRYDEMESVIKEYLEHKHREYQEFLQIEKQYLELKQKFG